MGMKFEASIKINVPKEIEVDIKMTPISIAGGLLSLRKSEKDEEKGASIYVKVTMTEVTVKIHAYAFLMGIGSNVVIDVSNKGMKFFITGNLFNVIEANVTVKASYGKLSEAAFTVSEKSFFPTIAKYGESAYIDGLKLPLNNQDIWKVLI